jgi:cytochrome c oxidase subunit 2
MPSLNSSVASHGNAINPIVKGQCIISFEQYLLSTTEYSSLCLSGFLDYLFEINNFILLPLYATIKTVVTSIDVIHSLGIFSFGCKIDAIPGRLNLAFSLRLF